MRKLVVAAAVAGAVLLAGAPGASGAITASAVTDPTESPTFLDPDTDLVDVPLTVSGTATGAEGDAIDIACALDDGGEGFALTSLSGPLTLAADGTFSATVEQLDFAYYICRLIAVPAGATAPYNVSAFQGPVVGNAGHSTDPIATTGPNAGVLANYSQQQSSPEGYWSVGSAGDVPLGESYPVEPGTLDYHDVLWGATTLRLAASSVDCRRCGSAAATPTPRGPRRTCTASAGSRTSSTRSSRSAGEMRVTATEPLTLCEPEDTCTSLHRFRGRARGEADGRRGGPHARGPPRVRQRHRLRRRSSKWLIQGRRGRRIARLAAPRRDRLRRARRERHVHAVGNRSRQPLRHERGRRDLRGPGNRVRLADLERGPGRGRSGPVRTRSSSVTSARSPPAARP